MTSKRPSEYNEMNRGVETPRVISTPDHAVQQYQHVPQADRTENRGTTAEDYAANCLNFFKRVFCGIPKEDLQGTHDQTRQQPVVEPREQEITVLQDINNKITTHVIEEPQLSSDDTKEPLAQNIEKAKVNRDKYFQDHFHSLLREKELSLPSNLPEPIDRNTGIKYVEEKCGVKVALLFAEVRGLAYIEKSKQIAYGDTTDISEKRYDWKVHRDPNREGFFEVLAKVKDLETNEPFEVDRLPTKIPMIRYKECFSQGITIKKEEMKGRKC